MLTNNIKLSATLCTFLFSLLVFLSVEQSALASCGCPSGEECAGPCWSGVCYDGCRPETLPCGATSETGCECDEALMCPINQELTYKRCVICGEPDPTDPPGPTSTPTLTRTPTPTPTPLNTPTPTLPMPTNFGGSCNAFGGSVSLNWQYTGNGNGYRIARTHNNGSGYDDQHWPHAVINSVNNRTYTDVRQVPGPPENEILAGPYEYYVRACYDYTTAGSCGPYTSALTINCPTPVPLVNMDAQCVYPFGPIELTWSQSSPAPPVAETNRHIAKYAGSWNYRYVSLSGSTTSYTDNVANITPGVEYGYNIRRCYTEYGTGTGDCRYNSEYANQDNVTCNIRARCDSMSLGLPSEGCWLDGAITRCIRGSTVSGTASGYNGSLGTPPFDTATNWDKTSVVRVLFSTPVRVADNDGSNTVSYTIPTDSSIPLNTEIEYNTNIRWTGSTVYDPDTGSQVHPICVRGNAWGPSAPVVGAECDNSCTAKLTVSCNINEWSNWTTCDVDPDPSYTYCTRTRTNECATTQTEECPGLFPDPSRTFCIGPTYTPSPTNTPTITLTITNTPTVTNTPPPGATNTPTPTRTPTLTPTHTPVPPTITHTPTLTPVPATPTSTPTPTTPPSEPTFDGELFYDFNENGVYNTGCAAGQIVEKIDSSNFGCTGNLCDDCTPRTDLAALLGILPQSLEGFEFSATPLGGTAVVYGENPKYRVRAGTNTGYYYFAVQHNNNYRLTTSDPQSATRSCSFTTSNPRNIYVGSSAVNDIDVGVHCVAMPTPTHTPTPTPITLCGCSAGVVTLDNCTPPEVPVCLSQTLCDCYLPTATPTPTLTNTPTPTRTPTPTNYPELVITGSFQQRTGTAIRVAPGQLSGRLMPVINPLTVLNFLSENVNTGMPGCHLNPNCNNLPAYPGSVYNSYRCVIQFPMSCALVIPQTFSIAGNISSLLNTWYQNSSATISIPGVNPPTSYEGHINFTYLGTAGWVKVIGSDIIRSSNVSLANNIPLITDRFDSDPTNPDPYSITETTYEEDWGNATMLDVFNLSDVGGVVAGPVDTMPANSKSGFGGSVSSYSLGSSVASNQQALVAYVQELLAAKPVSAVSSYTETAQGRSYSVGEGSVGGSAGVISVTQSDLEAPIEVNDAGVVAGTTNVLIFTDSGGNLIDVIFNNDVNPLANSTMLVIAKNITLADSVTSANAIFIASENFNTGSGGLPLVIKGNVVALGGLEQNRARQDGDHARPSMLLIYDAQAYLSLLKMLSITNLEYKITQ